MLNIANTKKMYLIPLLGLAFLWQPATAQARGWERGRGKSNSYDHHEQYPTGKAQKALPKGFINIVFGGSRFFFSEGLFYRHDPQGYVVVRAPVGAVVYSIPNGWRRVVIGRVEYYSCEGVYYQRIPGGYRVVQPPTTVYNEPEVYAFNRPIEQGQNYLTVNIPNSAGGYTAVLLKRAGNGFVGPQGEYYAEFPQVQQLRMMYAR